MMKKQIVMAGDICGYGFGMPYVLTRLSNTTIGTICANFKRHSRVFKQRLVHPIFIPKIYT